MGDDAKDLLMLDYKYISESIWKNEQAGETRVNLFISLVTLAIGGLIALLSKDTDLDEAQLLLIVVVGLLCLIAIGLVTWRRMIVRNTATDAYKRRLDTIRETFRSRLDAGGVLRDYDLFGGLDSAHPKRRSFGGLRDTVAVVNGLLIGGLGAAVFLLLVSQLSGAVQWDLSAAWPLALAVGVIFGGCAIYLQTDRIGRRGDQLAGGVVYDSKNGIVHYLIVRSKNPNNVEWVLPKGHVEPNEFHLDAALREVREEAGVVAGAIGLVGRFEIKRQDRADVATFYLMKKLHDVAPAVGEEQRDPKWKTFEDAIGMLSFEESRAMLRLANERLTAGKS